MAKRARNFVASGDMMSLQDDSGRSASVGVAPQDESSDELVRLIYRSVLRREADESGVRYFGGELRRGRSVNSILEEFVNCEEFQTSTKLFVPPGHFYSPVVDQREAIDYFARLAPQPVAELPGIDISREAMLSEWKAFLPYLRDIPFGAQKSGQWRYGFENPAYSWADGSLLHAVLRRFKPRRLIEVGSGWSSACAIDTIENFLGGACEVTFIEPYPALLKELVASTSVQTLIIDQPIQNVPLDRFESLEAGDVLFIDSTHVVKTGSDVCHEVFDILPRLKSGVLLHFHDVFWPFEYPRAWAVDDNRSWNELYLLRAFLQNNSDWRVVFFNDYMAKMASVEIARDFPDFFKNTGGALWLQRR